TDLDPVSYFGFERHLPFTDEISEPYRLDCALTYKLPTKSDQRAAPTKRVDRELDTAEWKLIIDKAWAARIPQIIFTGGEPTQREDLVELVAYTESIGMVTGLLTDGLKLSDTSYLDKLLQAGLDHAMIILSPDDDQSWDSLASFSYWSNVLKEDIFVTAHLTLTPENKNVAKELLDKLAIAGVSAVSLSANSASLHDELLDARSYADEIDLELIWDLPVPYSKINPVAVELISDDEETHVDGAGIGWMYVEPDGDILNQQGGNTVLGNMLTDSWEDISKTSNKL
ncbi:MAG: radical SAM protein, partial [Chloroflexota bacterium]